MLTLLKRLSSSGTLSEWYQKQHASSTQEYVVQSASMHMKLTREAGCIKVTYVQH